MLDIKFVRNNPDVVKQNIKNKFQDRKLPLVDEVIELDKENREIKQEVQALRADRNKLSNIFSSNYLFIHFSNVVFSSSDNATLAAPSLISLA